MNRLLGWRWSAGYVVGASVVGCMLLSILSMLGYVLLLVVYRSLNVFWHIVSYYQQFRLDASVIAIIAVNAVGYIFLVLLLHRSKTKGI